MRRSARSNKKRSILASLGPAALAQVEQQLGTAEFQRVYKGATKHGARNGKYNVSAEAERQVDGITFDSKWEANVYKLLCRHLGRQRFSLQPRFLLQEGFRDALGKWHMPIVYVSDFLIGPPRTADAAPLGDHHFVLDAKGMLTSVFQIKEKLFLYRYQAAERFLKPRTPSDVLNLVKLVNDGVPRLSTPPKTKRDRRKPNSGCGKQ